MDWLIIEEFPTYAISEYGEVCNIRTDRILRPSHSRGRSYVTLTQDRIEYTRQISTLMLNTWQGRDPRIRFDTVMHLDGDKTNCRLMNLMWRPRWFVHAYYTELNQDLYPRWSTPLRVIETGEIFHHPRECAMEHGLLQTHIARSVREGVHVFPTFMHCVRI